MHYTNVKVCKGPNCKAWSSDRIARELRKTADNLDLSGIKVCRVPCMDACHGGVSVRIGCKGKIFKLNEAEEALTILGVSNDSVAC